MTDFEEAGGLFDTNGLALTLSLPPIHPKTRLSTPLHLPTLPRKISYGKAPAHRGWGYCVSTERRGRLGGTFVQGIHSTSSSINPLLFFSGTLPPFVWDSKTKIKRGWGYCVGDWVALLSKGFTQRHHQSTHFSFFRGPAATAAAAAIASLPPSRHCRHRVTAAIDSPPLCTVANTRRREKGCGALSALGENVLLTR